MSWLEEAEGMVPVDRGERGARVALNGLDGLGPRAIGQLIVAFGSAGAALHARVADWRGAGLAPHQVETLLKSVGRLTPEADLAKVEAAGVRAVVPEDAECTESLRRIAVPPPVFFVRGTLLPDDRRSVAVVGSRRASTYGLWMARRLGFELAEFDMAVISGLARGIDTQAHQGAIDGGGRTVGVLGCGLDRIYPRENAGLAEQMVTCGALVSEFALGTPPLAGNFPRRNRLISALSRGVVVVEAGPHSGTIHTVNHAIDQNKEVFGVPGDVGRDGTAGPHALIRDGAALVTCGADIVESFRDLDLTGSSSGFRPKRAQVGGLWSWAYDERRGEAGVDAAAEVRAALRRAPHKGVDPAELAKRLRVPTSAVEQAVEMLTRQQVVERLPGGRVRGLR